MDGGHYKEICRDCRILINQCRCPSTDKAVHYTLCGACQTKAAAGRDVTDLELELARVLNKVSAENASNTPDFILAQYLRACLEAFNKASRAREQWYGAELRPGTLVPTLTPGAPGYSSAVKR